MEEIKAFLKAPLLDNLGITIKVGQLPSWAEYVPLRNWYSGGSRWQRFWQHTVLRLLTPRQYVNKLKKCRELELRIKQEFLNEVMDR